MALSPTYSGTTSTLDMRTLGDHASVARYDATCLTHVYRIVNLVNGKIYVGITTKGVRARMVAHRKAAHRGETSYLYAAMRKHGRDMFRATALCICTTMRAAMAEERRLIALWRPEYNLTDGGEGAWGIKRSPESIAKGAAALRGTTHKKDWTAAGLEAIRQGGRARRGVKQSPSHAAASRVSLEKAHAARVKPFICNETGEMFLKQRSAAMACGVSQACVNDVLLGKLKATKGLTFSFLPTREAA